jgi:hypothetical protein
VLIHGFDVVYFQHDLDPSAGSLVGRQLTRMALGQVRAQVQCDADRTSRERSIATGAFRRLLESKDAPVEIERGAQIVNEELESQGRAWLVAGPWYRFVAFWMTSHRPARAHAWRISVEPSEDPLSTATIDRSSEPKNR